MAEATPAEVVEQFITAFEQADFDTLAGLFTEDAIYHEMPNEPMQGRPAILAWLRDVFARAQPVAPWQRRYLVAQDNVVFSERVDHFTINGRHLSIPGACVYEIRDGKLAAVRDYWDSRKADRQLKDK